MSIIEKVNLSCLEATEMVEKKRDGKLSLLENASLLFHLTCCSLCAIFFDHFKVLDEGAKILAQKTETEQLKYPMKPSSKEELAEKFNQELH